MTLKVQFSRQFERQTHTSFKNYILKKHLFNFSHQDYNILTNRMHQENITVEQEHLEEKENEKESDYSDSNLPVTIVNLTSQAKDSKSSSSSASCTSKLQRRHRAMKCSHCDCNKIFTHRGDFNKHIRTHSGEKPYNCPNPNCGKSFAHSSNLRRHIVVHSGDKPFGCDKCGKCFNRKDKLLLHQKTLLCKKRSQKTKQTATS